jgi:division/cell wall cluster transcriptional repressor MraZ
MLIPGQTRRLFTGEHAYRLDSQRRVALPTAWRGESDNERSFMLLPHEQPCIQMVPMAMFEKLLPRLEEELLRSADALVAAGSTATMAAPVMVDRQGRFALSASQLAYAQITDRVLLVGGYLTLALWAPEVWEATRQAPATANRMLRSAAARSDDLGEAFRRAMGVQTQP